jgi:glutamine amidotransferase
MCRVLTYLGRPVLLDDLLFKPDSSLVRQCYDPRMMAVLNLAGFGMAAWDPDSHDATAPFLYKTPALPVFDGNLRQLARKIRPTALIAHVRGVPYSERSVVGPQNLHPFRYEGFPLAMAHNGDLWRFADMKFELLAHMRPAIAAQIQGTTDSEWIYALITSQLEDPTRPAAPAEIASAVERTLVILREVRERHDIRIASPVNLFLSDGTSLVVTRYTFDYGCYPDGPEAVSLLYPSLWYTSGREYGFEDGEWRMIGGSANDDSIIVASEPLTRDVSSWLELPEYSMLVLSADPRERRIGIVTLDV